MNEKKKKTKLINQNNDNYAEVGTSIVNYQKKKEKKKRYNILYEFIHTNLYFFFSNIQPTKKHNDNPIIENHTKIFYR